MGIKNIQGDLNITGNLQVDGISIKNENENLETTATTLVSAINEINKKVGTSNNATPNPSVGLEYQLNADNESYGVIGIGTCTDDFVIIPSEYEGLPVTYIGDYAFYEATGYEIPFTRIFIPKTITDGLYDAFPSHPIIVYCEAETQPDGWYPDWITSNMTVIWGYSFNAGRELPPCDSTNEGQFLRVVNGVPAWSAVHIGEEATF